MLNQSALDQYRQSHVMTASPEKLITLAFHGLLRFMKGAVAAHGRQDWNAFSQQLSRAQYVLVELASVLDMEKGGAIAANLAAIYDFALRQLLLADLRRDCHLVEQVIPVVNNIKEAWETICQPAAEPVAR